MPLWLPQMARRNDGLRALWGDTLGLGPISDLDYFRSVERQAFLVPQPKIDYRLAKWEDELAHIVWASLAICDPIYSDEDYSYTTAMANALAPGGSLYVFADSSGVAQTKIWLDCNPDLIFQNWIVWGPNDWGGRSKTRWGQKHDDILFYTKKGAPHTFNVDAISVPKKMTQAVFNPSGRTTKIPNSVWSDLAGFSTVASERVKINGRAAPWQKPEALIERIVKASSNPGELVLDPFSGVATIPLVCRRLGRSCLATEEDPEIYEAGRNRLDGLNPIC